MPGCDRLRRRVSDVRAGAVTMRGSSCTSIPSPWPVPWPNASPMPAAASDVAGGRVDGEPRDARA